MLRSPRPAAAAAVAVALANGMANPAIAQTPPDYGFQWATITHPGNRPANEQEAPDFYPPLSTPAQHVGDVNYQYRITRTEVTVGQWYEFVNAYYPYFDGFRGDGRFTGLWIAPTSTGPDPMYQMAPGAANRPTDTTWLMAARYCNWLCNNKATNREAFETGAYDISQFTQNPDGTWNGPATHAPSATFWIPTWDESIKALYYDPNKNGPGQEGYWAYPHASDQPPIPGFPWNGGQTAAGLPLNLNGPWLDVGAYPNVQSPWGLWDGSGGQQEWMEDATSAGAYVRVLRGTWQFFPNPEIHDRLDWATSSPFNNLTIGFRIASVPAPVGCIPLAIGALTLSTRRRSDEHVQTCRSFLGSTSWHHWRSGPARRERVAAQHRNVDSHTAG